MCTLSLFHRSLLFLFFCFFCADTSRWYHDRHLVDYRCDDLFRTKIAHRLDRLSRRCGGGGTICDVAALSCDAPDHMIIQRPRQVTAYGCVCGRTVRLRRQDGRRDHPIRLRPTIRPYFYYARRTAFAFSRSLFVGPHLILHDFTVILVARPCPSSLASSSSVFDK